jgi:transketolase
VSVEAAAPLGWDRYVGRHGEIFAMRSFGLSAPGPVVQAHFGFDAAHVLAATRQQIARHREGPQAAGLGRPDVPTLVLRSPRPAP